MTRSSSLRSTNSESVSGRKKDEEERRRTLGLVGTRGEEKEDDNGEEDGRGAFYKKGDLVVLDGRVGNARDAVGDETAKEEKGKVGQFC
jgi:hypothetical protein